MPSTHLILAASSLIAGASSLTIPYWTSTEGLPTIRSPARPRAAPTTVADGVTYDGCTYTVAGTGKFTERALYGFTGSSIPSGLYASGYTVYDTDGNPNAPYNHRFQTKNVVVSGGYMNLIVPGAQKPAQDSEKAINSAEVGTTRSDILYASVRTRAILSDIAGTCHGAFFYASDQAEIDIEYLSDPTSLSNTGTKPNPLWYTNQKATDSSPSTSSSQPGLSNQTTAINEYRVDWIKGQSKFYLNGRQQTQFTQNVPTVAGSWIWNNWANGDRGWSVGPPASTNTFKIQQIDMFFNTTSSGSKKCP